MRGLSLENVLWVNGTCFFMLLSAMLYRKRVYRNVPMFTAWINVAFLNALVLIIVSRFGTAHLYTIIFWAFALLDIALQIAVVYEFAQRAFRVEGIWPPKMRARVLRFSAVSGLIGVVSTVASSPAVNSEVDLLLAHLELLSSVFVFSFCLLIFNLAYQSGALWSQSDFRRFNGFLLWATASAFTDSIHAYWRTASSFQQLEVCRVLFSELIVAYWIVNCVFPKAEHRTAPPVGLGRIAVVYKNSDEGSSHVELGAA